MDRQMCGASWMATAAVRRKRRRPDDVVLMLGYTKGDVIEDARSLTERYRITSRAVVQYASELVALRTSSSSEP